MPLTNSDLSGPSLSVDSWVPRARFHEGFGTSQFSICEPGTRLKSREFPETGTAIQLIARAAVHTSFPPITWPRASRYARISPYSRAILASNVQDLDLGQQCLDTLGQTIRTLLLAAIAQFASDDRAGCNPGITLFGKNDRCGPTRISNQIAYDIRVEQIAHQKMSSRSGTGSVTSGIASSMRRQCDRSPSRRAFRIGPMISCSPSLRIKARSPGNSRSTGFRIAGLNLLAAIIISGTPTFDEGGRVPSVRRIGEHVLQPATRYFAELSGHRQTTSLAPIGPARTSFPNPARDFP